MDCWAAAEPWRTSNMETLARLPLPIDREGRGVRAITRLYELVQVTNHQLQITCHESSKSPPKSS
jgi:hypothetical protein